LHTNTLTYLRLNVHPLPEGTFFILWPWTFTCDFDLRVWPRQRPSEPAYEIFRSKVIWFRSYCPAQKHTLTTAVVG